MSDTGLAGNPAQWPLARGKGWTFKWARWHYVRNGESLCGKFEVRVLGRMRKPFKPALDDADLRDPVCETCDACALIQPKD